MNNQSYLLSERARVSFGSESSRLSSLGHLQSTEQSPFAAATRANAGRARGRGRARPRQPTRSSCCSKGILMLGLRPAAVAVPASSSTVDVVAVTAAAK